MQDGTVTTKSSHGRIGSISRTPTGFHFELGTGVHTLQNCSIYSYSRALGHGHILKTCSFLLFWDFYLPPVDECVVSRGCSRGEESCSLYLADPIAIIEVQGEEVLASTLDGDGLWRRGPGVPVFSELC
jgi:hypothetical protein